MTNVLEWLEKRAQEMPDKVAFADEHDEVSFLDLMRRARSVGSYLAGIVDERSPIACYMEKSTQTLAAMLGAVYARCCYSIIDVRQPASRAAPSSISSLLPSCLRMRRTSMPHGRPSMATW